MKRPLCFVLMPFGQKRDELGQMIDFDAVYEHLIKPAIQKAELEPLRADEERVGGFIHKPMFERLVLCEYAVADLTLANANVFYELGVRHGVRPWSTVLLFARGTKLPFDVAPLRAIPYGIRAGRPQALVEVRRNLTKALREARQAKKDSPVYTFLESLPAPATEIAREKTDVFRERVEYVEKVKEDLAKARHKGSAAVRKYKTKLEPIKDAEAGVVVDLFLSYRSVRDWKGMIDLVARMSRPLAQSTMIQEQLGFALNRAGRGDKAEQVLLRLIARKGPSSETCGILGRVYKDRWRRALKTKTHSAAGFLRKSVNTYLQGFETDWRDAYPGINAVTLMTIADPNDPRLEELIPVVRYAVKRRLNSAKADYWDHATLLELEVLANDREEAESALSDALAQVREPFEPETTAGNLKMIRKSREARGLFVDWAKRIESQLFERAAEAARS